MMRFLALAVFSLILSMRAGAQSPTLPARLSPEARSTLERVIDSVKAAGLPTSPLVDKVAEGVLKGADEQRIVLAVRNLAHELSVARDIIGTANDPALLGATASALHAGAAASDLRQLVRPSAGAAPDPHTIAVAFVALADLVTKRISPVAARQAVGELLTRHASDADFATLRSEIDQDIRDGVAPDVALSNRVRAQVRILDASPVDRMPVRRPPPV
jgi:hypothetical protein